jgi:Plavaka transposase
MRKRTQPSSHNKRSFLKRIDALPAGPGWSRHTVPVLGDILDGKGKLLREELELWLRNLVECVKDLIQNPAFRKSLAYAPERVY